MRTWLIVVALLVAPAPAFTQKVNVDSDRSTAFAHDDARTQQLVWRGTGTGHDRATSRTRTQRR